MPAPPSPSTSRHWGGNIDVTLVDANASHYLLHPVEPGRDQLAGHEPHHAQLRQPAHQVRRQRRSSDMRRGRRPGRHSTVTLGSGTVLPYDRLVLAPGIDFVPIPGWDPNLAPHAGRPARQTTLLEEPAGGHAGRRRRSCMTDPEVAVPLPARTLRARLRGGRLPDAQQARLEGDPARRQSRHHGRAAQLRQLRSARSTQDVIEYYTDVTVHRGRFGEQAWCYTSIGTSRPVRC
ncbi:MAG: hypothetical protein MZV65_52405 [Chromatiales bacterium]|nr:hypothetical protein [Chromatiales bacterium]